MILYHITQDLSHSGFFYPDIPSAILKGENQHILRVCTSKTIEGCLGSMPLGGLNIEDSMSETGDIFKVFRIDTEKLELTSILDSQQLLEDRMVMDAELSEECWILESFIVPEEDVFYIRIENYNVEIVGFDSFDFYLEMDELGISAEEFYNSEEYDADFHTDDFGLISDLEYRIIKEVDLETEVKEMKEELMIA